MNLEEALALQYCAILLIDASSALLLYTFYAMLDVEHSSPLPLSAQTDVTAEDQLALRRLSAALDSRFIALVLSDQADTRTRLLDSFILTLPAEEHRILSVSVPRSATHAQMTTLITRAAGLIAQGSEGDVRSRLAAYDMWRSFEADVLRCYAAGRRTLIIFDDAHLLSAAGMHLIHALSNITTVDHDLAVPIVLAANNSFAVRLRRPAWRALASRTGAIVRLAHR